MTSTATNVIDKALYHLKGNTREEYNKLASSINSSVTTIVMSAALRGIQINQEIEIGTEIIYVLDIDTTTRTITDCIRGFKGSTAASHTADDAVTVGPRFYRHVVLTEINNELKALSGKGVFRIRSLDIDYDAAIRGYDITSITDLIDVYEIRIQYPTLEGDWRLIRDYEVARGMPTTDFPSGNAILIDELAQTGYPMRIRYRAGFTTLASGSDVVETVSGIHTEAVELLELGAAIGMIMGREIPRNDMASQKDPRRSEEVPSQSILASYRGLLNRYSERLDQERTRLVRMYPQRSNRYKFT